MLATVEMYGVIIFWIAFMIFLLIIEGMTLGLTTVWFAAGALAAAVTAVITEGEYILIQIVVFTVVSLLTLLAVRPMVAERLKKINEVNKTGVDTMIGKDARVEEEINNSKNDGRVDYNGMSWAARSAGGEVIPVGTEVRIKQIQGVKLIVEKAE